MKRLLGTERVLQCILAIAGSQFHGCIVFMFSLKAHSWRASVVILACSEFWTLLRQAGVVLMVEFQHEFLLTSDFSAIVAPILLQRGH